VRESNKTKNKNELFENQPNEDDEAKNSNSKNVTIKITNLLPFRHFSS
jgi:hypothetical protein